jgi:hypothetical protein
VGAPPVPVSAALTTTIAQLMDVSSAGQAEDLMARVLELLETVEGETALERSRWVCTGMLCVCMCVCAVPAVGTCACCPTCCVRAAADDGCYANTSLSL